MLISAFILSKFAKFGILLDSAELEGLLVKHDIGTLETYTVETIEKAETAICELIPEMLVTSGIQEGGYSIHYDREGILAYYRFLCANLGKPDLITNQQPKIRNKSNRW